MLFGSTCVRPLGCVIAGVILVVCGVDAQQPSAQATLAISGSVSKPLTLTTQDIKALPRTSVTVTEEGREVKYDGVLVGEVLARTGAPLGRDLTGAAVATYVIATAKDGYRAVFSLAELDPAFTGSEIIVADTIDGKPLVDYQGPLRIVAPHDKHGARSVRMLQSLDVVRLPK